MKGVENRNTPMQYFKKKTQDLIGFETEYLEFKETKDHLHKMLNPIHYL